MFAYSKAGHDKGHIYLVIAVEGDRVSLCDGDKRPLDNPKIKNIKHIQPVRDIPEEFRQMCRQNDNFYNEGIKRALKVFSRRREELDVKG